jgi:hypothetical protein
MVSQPHFRKWQILELVAIWQSQAVAFEPMFCASISKTWTFHQIDFRFCIAGSLIIEDVRQMWK